MISKILLLIYLTSVSCQNTPSLSLSNVTKIQQPRLKRSESGPCGVPSQSTSLVVGGKEFTRGTWPWMVALMQKNSTPPKLFCGGVLVSANKVVTGETTHIEVVYSKVGKIPNLKPVFVFLIR